MGDGLFTGREAIRYLGLDRCGLADPAEALRWLRRTGKLTYIKVGRHIHFRKAWLDELIERGACRRAPTATRRS